MWVGVREYMKREASKSTSLPKQEKVAVPRLVQETKLEQALLKEQMRTKRKEWEKNSEEIKLHHNRGVKSERRKERNKVHLLVMIAERVWKTKFWNVHQSSFSIPGMRGRGKRKQLRPASSPNDGTAPSETTLPKAPSSTAPPSLHRYVGLACVCVSMCVVYVCLCIYVWGRESVSECM